MAFLKNTYLLVKIGNTQSFIRFNSSSSVFLSSTALCTHGLVFAVTFSGARSARRTQIVTLLTLGRNHTPRWASSSIWLHALQGPRALLVSRFCHESARNERWPGDRGGAGELWVFDRGRGRRRDTKSKFHGKIDESIEVKTKRVYILMSFKLHKNVYIPGLIR